MTKYEILEIENGGLKIEVCNLGCRINRLFTADRDGKMADVVLGYDKPSDYLKHGEYFGAAIGRVCNRIAGASAKIDGKRYKFYANDATNSLHGGNAGFDRQIWDMREISGDGYKGVNFHFVSPDMAGGYPGNLDVSIDYKLCDGGMLAIKYRASTDKPTLCALTNHSYFNLSAGKSEDILDHRIKINASFFTPIDSKMAPTGEIASVKGTVLDLRNYKPIRSGVESDSELMREVGGGYDHNYVLPNSLGEMVEAASVFDPSSGRLMEVFTDEPGMQFYTGNFISRQKGKNGAIYDKHSGFCLETQHWPNAANLEHFPSMLLLPNEVYASTTVYRFGCLK